MSASIQVSGKNFDYKFFANNSNLNITEFPSANGFSIQINNYPVYSPGDTQKRDVADSIRFIKQNYSELKRLSGLKGLKRFNLLFVTNISMSRVNFPGRRKAPPIFINEATLPVKLLKMLGDLNMGIKITQQHVGSKNQIEKGWVHVADPGLWEEAKESVSEEMVEVESQES